MKRTVLNVTSVSSELTGGGCMTYFGKLSDGRYFSMQGSELYFYDDDYAPQIYAEDAYEWCCKHTIGKMDNANNYMFVTEDINLVSIIRRMICKEDVRVVVEVADVLLDRETGEVL